MLTITQLVIVLCCLSTIVIAKPYECRDRTKWPFSAQSIWNMPIGSNAEFARANIFQSIKPKNFFSDDDYFFETSYNDPRVPWYDQGWWGEPSGEAHCNITGKLVAEVYFPHDTIVTAFGNNNAAGILQPDNITLLQLQPIYRCKEGSPVLAQAQWLKHNVSILGEGAEGAHGGSGLSSIGGTIRLKELLPDSPPIRHALKLELFAKDYYYGGEEHPCYHWPARTCDGYAHDPHAKLRYNGTNPYLTPGSLLAVPKDTQVDVSTVPGKKILSALRNYGGYLCDDTADNRGTICTEHGVTDEFMNEYKMSFNSNQGPFYDDLLAIFQALQIVKNNTPTSIGGGGIPIVPIAPPICGA